MKPYSVMTFNLLSDFTYPWSSKKISDRLPVILACLNEHQPDILCVQEYTKSMRKAFRSLEKDYQVVGQYRASFFNNEANLIFIRKNRFQILRYQTFWLSKKPTQKGSKLFLSQFPRIVTLATVQDPYGKKLTIANTHLDANFESIRFRQFQILLSLLPEDSVILCGDMNTTLSKKTLSTLDSSWTCPPPLGTTVNRKIGSIGHQQEAIDQIFIHHLKLLNIRKIKKDYAEQEPSDHYPLFATFSFLNENPVDEDDTFPES